MKKRYMNVVRDGNKLRGEYTYDGKDADYKIGFEADWSLFRIYEVWMDSDEGSARIWALQDGYGEAGFTPSQGYDWSGVRDSSPEAKAAMDAVAREYLSDDEMNELLGLSSES